MTEVEILIRRNSVDGIEISGAAIGSDFFVSPSKRVKKLEEILDSLVFLDDSQCNVGKLRFCIWPPKLSTLCDAFPFQTNQIKSNQKIDSDQRARYEGILGV